MTKGGEFKDKEYGWAVPIENTWTKCRRCCYNIPKTAYSVDHNYCPSCGTKLQWTKADKPKTYRCKACVYGPCELKTTKEFGPTGDCSIYKGLTTWFELVEDEAVND